MINWDIYIVFVFSIDNCCEKKNIPNTCRGLCACGEDKWTSWSSDGAVDYLEFNLGECEGYMKDITECQMEMCPRNFRRFAFRTINVVIANII